MTIKRQYFECRKFNWERLLALSIFHLMGGASFLLLLYGMIKMATFISGIVFSIIVIVWFVIVWGLHASTIDDDQWYSMKKYYLKEEVKK